MLLFTPARKTLSFSILLLLIGLLLCTTASAQTKTATWTGKGTFYIWSWSYINTTDWNNADNWSPKGVPDATTTVIIGQVANNPILAESNAVTVYSLAIQQGGNLTMRNLLLKVTAINGVSIHNGGTLINQGSDMVVNGNWENNGTYQENVYATGSTSYYPTIDFGGQNHTIGGASLSAFNYLVIRGQLSLLNPITIKPLGESALSKFEVLGTFDPGSFKVSFATAPAAGFVLGDAAVLKVKAPTFGGNYELAAAPYFPTAMFPNSVIDYAAEGNQSVLAATYSRLNISGSGIKTLAGNITISPGSSQTQVNILAGTLNLGTYTLKRTGPGAVAGGALTIANGGTLQIGGTGTFPEGFATRDLSSSSTVEYNGSKQTVSHEVYGNLTLSGSGTKTMPAAAMVVAGTLTGAGSAAFTAGGNVTVNGDVLLSGTSNFNGGSFIHTVGGNWTDNATFAGASSTVMLKGAGKTINRTAIGSAAFTNLTIAGAGISITAPAVIVNGNLQTTEAGAFSQVGNGTLTMTGNANTISGSGITLQNLTVSGSISTAGTFEIKGNLTVSAAKSFSATAGTINFTGAGKTIASPGMLTLFGVRVNGTLATASTFDIKSDLSGAGKLTATAGTINFSGTSTFNGTHDLYHVHVSGTRLRMAANASMGVAGNFTVATVFDVATNKPSTVTFNGTAAQTIPGITYHHVALERAGAKTAVASIVANGNLSIGKGTEFNAGAYTHFINGNWTNSGTFNHNNGTVILAGAANTSMAGATTFSALTLNKASAGNTVTLGSDITTAILNMASGLLMTGTNKVNLTQNRTGNGWVVGTLRRVHLFEANKPYNFNGPFVQNTFGTVTGISEMSVTVLPAPITNFPAGAAVNGTFVIAIPYGTYTNATLQLQYQDSELNGNMEDELQLYKYTGSNWVSRGKLDNNTSQDWVRQTSLTDIASTWTLSAIPNVLRWKGSKSTAWEDAANWEVITSGTPVQAMYPPYPTTIVSFGGIVPVNQPAITSGVQIKALRFSGDAPIALSLGAGGALSVAGNVTAAGSGASVRHTINTGAQNLTVGGDLILNDGSTGNSVNLVMGAGTTTVAGDLRHAGDATIALGSGNFFLSGSYNLEAPLTAFDKGTGTFTYTGSSSQVIGVVYYNNLTIDKPAGVATLTAPAEGRVGGDVIIKSGTLSIPGGTYTLQKGVIQSGGTLQLGSSTISVQSDWVKTGGTFEAGTSNITLMGSNLTASSPLTFNNLTIDKKPGTTLNFTGNALVNNTLELQSGTINLGSGSLNRSAAGGRFVMGDTAILQLSGSNFPANYNNMQLSPGSTVRYQGTGPQQVAATTYGNLEIANGGAAAKKLLAATQVAGTLTIETGATLNGDEKILTLSGSFVNNGSFIAGAYTSQNPPGGTLVLAPTGGAVKQITGNALTVNNLVVQAGANYALQTDMTVNGNTDLAGNHKVYIDPDAAEKQFDLENNSVFNTGSSHVSVAGDFKSEGILVGAGIRTFTGTRRQIIHLNAPMVPGEDGSVPTVIFDGTTPPVFNSTAAPVFADIIIKNTGGIRTSVNWTIGGTLDVRPGATFDGGTHTHTIYTGLQNTGTIVSAGTINFAPAAATVTAGSHVFNLGTTANAFISTGTLVVSGTGKVRPTGTLPAAFNNLVLVNANPEGISMAELAGEHVRVTGNVTIGSSTIWHGGNKKYTLDGNVNNDGVIDAGNADFTLTSAKPGAGDQPDMALLSGAGSVAVGNFIVGENARLEVSQELVSIYKDFAHNGAVFNGTRAELKFKGTAAASIRSKGGQPINIQHVHIAKTNGATVTLQAPLEGVANLMVESGTLDVQAQTIATAQGTKDEALNHTPYFSVQDEAFYRVAGGSTLPDFKTYELMPASTVVYEGAAQDVKNIQYGNLQLLNSGIKTFVGDTAKVAGVFTLAKSVSVIAPKVVVYNGAAAQAVAAINYNDLILSNYGRKTLTTGTTGIARKFILADTTTLDAAGADVTVDYNGAEAQQVLPTNYYNLKLSNASIKQFSGTTGIAAGFILAGGATADLSGENTINFNGTRDQDVPALSYNNLHVSGVGLKNMLGDAAVEKQLVLTAGQISTGKYKITLGMAAGSISETEAAYVTGTVETQRLLATAREDFGGIGLAVTPKNAAPGLTTVSRLTGTPVGINQNSVLRSYAIRPAGANTALDATVEMFYFDHELNTIAEENLAFYTSSDGVHWAVQPPDRTMLSSGNNSATLTGVSSLQGFALGDRSRSLPVEIIYFSATISGKDALLNWATATEADNKGFVVEVSADGYTYRQLGFVKSKMPTSSVRQKYSFTDTENGKTGMRYYRLKQTDFSGEETAYGPKALDFGYIASAAVAVYPNPFSSSLALAVEAVVADVAAITVYDAVGKKLFAKEQRVPAGASTVPLPLQQIRQTGVYLLTVALNGQVHHLKVVRE